MHACMYLEGASKIGPTSMNMNMYAHNTQHTTYARTRFQSNLPNVFFKKALDSSTTVLRLPLSTRVVGRTNSPAHESTAVCAMVRTRGKLDSTPLLEVASGTAVSDAPSGKEDL